MKKIAVIVLVLGGLTLAACGNNPSGDTKDRRTSDALSRAYSQSQPAPRAPHGSQLRKNIIEIEKSQIETTQTTSFFFSRGASGTGAPLFQCPSIGYPISTTMQLTNPTKEYEGVTINQIEPNGVFTGDSSGTYVICVNAQGKGYSVYWEGDVMAFSGPAAYDPETRQVQLVGQPTVQFSTTKK